jgi:hypothetical protein
MFVHGHTLHTPAPLTCAFFHCDSCATRLLCCPLSHHIAVCPAQFDINQKTALVQYPETHEEEWINLIELVQERCIAVGEWGCSRRHA